MCAVLTITINKINMSSVIGVFVTFYYVDLL